MSRRLQICVTAVALLAALMSTPQLSAASPTLPAVPEAPAQETGEWCGAPGQSSGYVPMDEVHVATQVAQNQVWYAAPVAGSFGVPAGTELVELKIWVFDPSPNGVLRVGADQSPGNVATLLFDEEDAWQNMYSIVVPLNAAGEFMFSVFATAEPVTLAFYVTGYFEEGAEDGTGFTTVENRTVTDTITGVGVPASGKVSSISPDVTIQDSGVPADAVAAQVTINVQSPDAAAIVEVNGNLVGAIRPGEAWRQSMAVPLVDGTFVVEMFGAGGVDPVAGHVRVAVDGYHGVGTSTFVSTETRVSSTSGPETLAPGQDHHFTVPGVGDIPDHGIVAAQVAIHVVPGPGESGLPGGALNVWPAGDAPPRLYAGWWPESTTVLTNRLETVVSTVEVGDEGEIALRWEGSPVPATAAFYVDVLGLYCDRDLPPQPVLNVASHPLNEWSDSPVVEATWNLYAAVPDSMLAGYAVEINDDAYFDPEPLPNRAEPSYSGPAPGGRTWLHVRAISKDGTASRTSHYPLQTNGGCTSLEKVSYVPLTAPAPVTSGSTLHNTAAIANFGDLPGLPSNATSVRLQLAGKSVHTNQSASLYVHPGDQPFTAGGAAISFEDATTHTETIVNLGEYDGHDQTVAFTASGSLTFSAAVTGYFVNNGGDGYQELPTTRYLAAISFDGQTMSSVVVDPSEYWGEPTGIPADEVSAVAVSILVNSVESGAALEVRESGAAPWHSLVAVDDPNEYHSASTTLPLGPDGSFETRLTNGASGSIVVVGFGWYGEHGSEFHPFPDGARQLLSDAVVGPDSDVHVSALGPGLPSSGLSGIEGTIHVQPASTNTYAITGTAVYPTGASRNLVVGLAGRNEYTVGEGQSFAVHASIGTDGSQTGFQLWNAYGTNIYSFDAVGYFCRPTPKITSSSHPDEASTYAPTDLAASWTINEDSSTIAGWQVAYDSDPTFVFPSALSPSPTTDTDMLVPAAEVEAGVSWIFVRAISATGVPSETARYRVNTQAGLDDRDLALGLEPWWTFDQVPLASTGAAQVNVATGNVVVQQDDLPATQAAGDLAFNARRTYNSQETTGLLDSLFGVDIGDGWSLNVTDMSGIGGLVGVDLVDTDLDLEHALDLTMVDRDGTEHTFTPSGLDATVGPVSLSVNELPDLLDAVGNPLDFLDELVNLLSAPDLTTVAAERLRGVLSLPEVQLELRDLIDADDLSETLAICADVRYEAPPGVHVDLWRYLLVDLNSTTSSPNGACGLDPAYYDNPPGPVVSLGYATVRPDRVSQTFGFDGRLRRLVDSAGNALAYDYDLFGRLVGVYEPGVDGCTSSTSAGCRTMQFTYGSGTVAVTDPAGRTVTYTKNSNNELVSVEARTSGNALLEQWAYDYTSCNAAGRLCEIHTPRQLDIADTAVATPMTFAYDGDGRVTSITEPSDGVDPGVETTYTWTDTHSDRVRGGQAVRYAGIDEHGRVSDIIAAAPADLGTAPLRHTRQTWDTEGGGCTDGHPDGQIRDNNLCTLTQVAVGGETGGDRVTEYNYNPEGRAVVERRVGVDGLADAVTTNGFRTIAYDATGHAHVLEDTIDGNGQVTVAARPDNMLFTVSDQTGALPPNGNDAGPDWQAHRTRFVVDASAGQRIGTVGTGGDCGDGNSGLVCRVEAPEGEDTEQRYNERGQQALTQMFAGGEPTGTTTYLYFNDTDPSRAGWLHQAVDATGANAVTYAYDAASNVTAVWDRNAQQRAGGGVPTDLADATQIEYNSGAGGTGPWRWDSTTTLPYTAADTAAGLSHGARTTTVRDAHGNPVRATPPRGVVPADGSFDTTTLFDARDLPIEIAVPDGAGGTDLTETSFDENALAVRTEEPNERVTATVYDGAGRATETVWTRAKTGSPDPGCRTATAADQTLLSVSAAHVVCESSTLFDSFDQTIKTTDPTGLETYTGFDHYGRQKMSTWTSTVGFVHTAAGYDLNGNQTVTCGRNAPATIANNCASYAGQTSDLPPGVTVTDYDTSDRAITTTYTRTPVDSSYAATGSGVTVQSSTTYDTAGRVTSTTDPNGNTTTTDYDDLSRQIAQTVPRAGTTRWRYDPSGNTIAILKPATPTTVGAVQVGGEWMSVTGYVWDETNRATVQVEAAQADTGFDALVPAAAAAAGDPVVNVRTEYAYDVDGNLIATLTPRAFQSGTIAAPDKKWLQQYDYDQRSLPVKSYRAKDSTQAGTCTTGTPTGAATARFGFGSTATCVTTTSYDDAGNPVEIHTPGSKSLTHGYNLDRLVTSTTATAPDGNGTIQTTARYDGAGRVVEATRPGADSAATPWATTIDYSQDGLVTQVTETDGTTTATTLNTYDPAGQLLTSTTGGTNVTPVATATGYHSDGATRTASTGGLTTSYTLDLNGNVVQITQPETNTVTQSFTADNLLETQVEQVGPTSARTTTFGYDPMGNKTTETVATDGVSGRQVGYRYQATGWLAAEFNPAAPTDAITYGHNLDGTMATATDTTGPIDTSINLAWSTAGTQTNQTTYIGGVQLASSTVSHRADGELVGSFTNHGGQASWTSRTYAAGASRPASASIVMPGQALSAGYTWTDTGQLDQLTVGSTTVENRTYRSDGAVTAVATPSGTHNYTVDGHGRTLTHNATGLGGPSQTYGYDGAGRLTGNGTDTFGYDDNNNRTLWERPDQRTESTYRDDNSIDTDTITVLPAGTPVLTGDYPQDAAGRRTHPFLHNENTTPTPPDPKPSLDDCVYVYDFLNRTIGINETATDGCVDPDAEPDDDGNYMLTLHDPLNREIAHLTSADPTVDLDAIAAAGINSTATFNAPANTDLEIDIRIYGIGDHLSRTHTSDHTVGSVVTDVGFYEADGTILRHTNTNDPAETQLLGTDGHGNITTITSAAGATICERFYEPFGTEHDTSDCTDDDTINQRWYRGGIQNDTDDTYTYGSRHYDPETGTWTTPDTARPQAPLTDLSIGTDPLTQNRYTYVNGDPINLVDPSGHRPDCAEAGECEWTGSTWRREQWDELDFIDAILNVEALAGGEPPDDQPGVALPPVTEDEIRLALEAVSAGSERSLDLLAAMGQERRDRLLLLAEEQLRIAQRARVSPSRFDTAMRILSLQSSQGRYRVRDVVMEVVRGEFLRNQDRRVIQLATGRALDLKVSAAQAATNANRLRGLASVAGKAVGGGLTVLDAWITYFEILGAGSPREAREAVGGFVGRFGGARFGLGLGLRACPAGPLACAVGVVAGVGLGSFGGDEAGRWFGGDPLDAYVRTMCDVPVIGRC